MLKQRTVSSLRVLRRFSDSATTAVNVARELSMATSYVEQICAVLAKKMQLLQGKRGRGGGYTLIGNLEQTTLNELHTALYDSEPQLRIPITLQNAMRFLHPEQEINPPKDKVPEAIRRTA